MKYAWSKTNVFLKLLLDPSSPGTLLEDHLLVNLVLTKRIHRDQVRSTKIETRQASKPSRGWKSASRLSANRHIPEQRRTAEEAPADFLHAVYMYCNFACNIQNEPSLLLGVTMVREV